MTERIAPDADAVPLIWTKYGLIPLTELALTTERTDAVDQVEFHVGYVLKDTGEVVQRSTHILPLAPWQTGAGGRVEKFGLGAAQADVG